VDKILHGANPAALPVAGATQFTCSVNRPALARLGLSLPPDISARVNDWLDLLPLSYARTISPR
jgi:ABC-type uncharacterized transport system substrate-binding protein